MSLYIKLLPLCFFLKHFFERVLGNNIFTSCYQSDHGSVAMVEISNRSPTARSAMVGSTGWHLWLYEKQGSFSYLTTGIGFLAILVSDIVSMTWLTEF